MLNQLISRYGRPVLGFLIPSLSVLAAVFWWLNRSDAEVFQARTRAAESRVIEIARRTVTAEISMLRSDTQILANQTSLHRWLAAPGRETLNSMEADLLSFARNRSFYEQLRYLDEHGREIVRINRSNGGPTVARSAGFRDRSTRDDVTKILALGRGEVYVSRFDRNSEDSPVEEAFKPVIHVGTPVYDLEGRRRGLIVLNYLAERLLGMLRAIGKRDHSLWLLNREGYWLLGPGPAMEWGLMYRDRKAQRFDLEYPEAWNSIQSAPATGQFMNAHGLFSYARLDAGDSSLGPSVDGWCLVSFVPAAAMTENMERVSRNLVIVFIGLAGLLAGFSAVVARKEYLRRKTESAIRESEDRYRGLVDSAPDAIVLADEVGTILLINGQTEKYFGYSRQELLGERVERLIPRRFHKKHVGYRKGYALRPSLRPMGNGASLYGLRKDGSEFPVEISLSPTRTEKGLLITCIIRDVSQSQIQKRYQELINNLPVGVYRNTPGSEGKYLEVNPAMLEIFEAESVEELTARSVASFYCDPADRARISDKIMRLGSVKSEEIRLRTLRGREFDGAITAAVKKDANGNVFFDGILKDISERKEHERRIRELNERLTARSAELEAINQELESFSYSVSHDLRAPLRAIDGFSHLLLKEYSDDLDERGRDRLNRVYAAARRMATLIDDLLDLSKVSRYEVNREVIDLSAIANDVIQMLRQNDPSRKVACSVQPGLRTQGDPRLVRIVMDNLLGNAWKFTARREDARIEVGSDRDGAERCYFVRDNGVGFDMAYAEKLFGAFQRLHDAEEFSGTGIGLATVQRVIHKHGGRIRAESAVAKGATFYFTLSPVAEP